MIVDHTDVGAALRRYSMPFAAQMLGDQLLGIVDTIAIGSLGVVALAGATAAITLQLVLIFAMAGLWTGTSIITAQRIGANDLEGYGRAVRAGMPIPMLFALLATLAATLFGHRVLHGMIGDLASLHDAAIYLVLRCAALIPMAIDGTLIGSLGAAGNRKLGIAVLATINIVHVPLLLILGLGWFTHHPLGIVGIGISSLLAESIGAIFAVYYVARRPKYRIFSRLDADLRLAVRTATLGLPESVFLVTLILPDVAIVTMLAPLGALAISGFRALTIVSDATFVVPSPMQSTTQIVVGQRLGAGDFLGAQRFVASARRIGLAFSTLAGALVALFAWPLAFLFTLDATVASMAALPLALHMVTLPLKGIAQVSLAPIRASGDTAFSMSIGIFCNALVIPLAWLGIERFHYGLFSVPFAWIIAWIARAALTEWKLRTGSWLHAPPLRA